MHAGGEINFAYSTNKLGVPAWIDTHISTDKVYEGKSVPNRMWARPDKELGPLSFVAKLVNSLLSRVGKHTCPKCYPASFEDLMRSPDCCWPHVMQFNARSIKKHVDETIDEFVDVNQRPCMDAFNESFYVASGGRFF